MSSNIFFIFLLRRVAPLAIGFRRCRFLRNFFLCRRWFFPPVFSLTFRCAARGATSDSTAPTSFGEASLALGRPWSPNPRNPQAQAASKIFPQVFLWETPYRTTAFSPLRLKDLWSWALGAPSLSHGVFLHFSRAAW